MHPVIKSTFVFLGKLLAVIGILAIICGVFVGSSYGGTALYTKYHPNTDYLFGQKSIVNTLVSGMFQCPKGLWEALATSTPTAHVIFQCVANNQQFTLSPN